MDKRVKTQSIVAIVRQMSHEYTYLEWKKTDKVEGGGDKKGSKCRKGNGHFEYLTKKNVIKSKVVSFVVVISMKGKQIISQRAMVLKSQRLQLSSEYQYLHSVTLRRSDCTFTFSTTQFQVQKGKQIK